MKEQDETLGRLSKARNKSTSGAAVEEDIRLQVSTAPFIHSVTMVCYSFH